MTASVHCRQKSASAFMGSVLENGHGKNRPPLTYVPQNFGHETLKDKHGFDFYKRLVAIPQIILEPPD
ncbi:hypothetical protein [Rhizobium sophoriradicis]|uniref:hypothetical protein n=1 Tax=Rhizobium sophoriradicis TaxID=1535245 RepID=UPI0014827958|nr:hypothetical protein [Rhizobium sophoriradicis]